MSNLKNVLVLALGADDGLATDAAAEARKDLAARIRRNANQCRFGVVWDFNWTGGGSVTLNSEQPMNEKVLRTIVKNWQKRFNVV